MLNAIIKSSLNNRAVVLGLFGLLLMLGVALLTRMDVDIFPDLNAPTVVIMTEAPGMSSEEVEQIVTRPLETGLNGSANLRRLRSSSTSGFSAIWCEFDWGTDIYHARQTVAEKLTEISADLPPAIGSPVIGPQSSILGEMMIIGLTADTTDITKVRELAEWTVTPRLLALGGIAQVSVLGGGEKEFQVKLSPALMRQYGITVSEVLAAAEALNDNAVGGVINSRGNEFIVTSGVRTTSPDEISKAVVRADESGVVTLGDIAVVEEGVKTPVTGMASVNGRQSVLLTVTKQPGAPTLPLTEAIEREVNQLKSSFPTDIEVNMNIFRQSDFIRSSISNLQSSLLEGALFVIVILFFFLMNVRTTVISVVALPVSVIVTIILLSLLGLNINTMTLGGIAIAIGSLVDDAVVDVENVYRRLRENAGRLPVKDVVFAASKEVRYPIFNSSLIIIASFLPLFFLTGFEGRMLVPLGLSFIIALIASTVVALTLTPVLCSYLLGGRQSAKEDKEPVTARKVKELYGIALGAVMRHRTPAIATACLLFVLAVGLFFTLGRSFLPPFNEGSFTINVSALPGTPITDTDKIGRLAEQAALEVPEISVVARKTGRAELDEHALGTNVSEMEAPYKLDKRSRKEVEADLRARLHQIPGVNIEIGQPISHRIDAMLSGTQAQIAVKIFGPDLNRLLALGKKASQEMKSVPGLVDITVEQLMQRPEIVVRPKRALLAAYGMTNADFVSAMNVALSGVVVSQVYDDGVAYDLTVRVNPDDVTSKEQLGDITVDTSRGKVPLSSLAEIVETSGPNAINRENATRRIVVSANVSGGDLSGTVAKIRERLSASLTLPQGYYIVYGGQFENEESASKTLLLTSMLALVIIFMLLMTEFKSVSESLIVLINMPFAIIGGVIILCLTSGELNIPAIIGFISLMGISTRNGMLLISRYNSLAAEGADLKEAVRKGSVDRVLPIIMTALTSALALIPLALRGGEPGNEIQSPMAVVILGGLLSATLLNLFIVPVVYYINKKYKTDNDK